MTAADSAARDCLAPAKVNLTLHLCGRRADGLHLLDSLVVFPGIADRLSAEPARGLSLTISGPFAAGLSAGADNLVMRAAERLSAVAGGAGAALHLEKNLPIASGIGGGSTDAAAALRLLGALWDVTVPADLAPGLGADVPVCCKAPAAQRMQGIGERLSPAPPLPAHWLVLVNPLRGVETGAVFARVADPAPPAGPDLPARGFATFDEFRTWLSAGRNDLEAAAAGICPVIGEVLAALAPAPLARMSGSGATCFGVFEGRAEADALAERLRQATAWWVAVGPVAAHPAASG